MTATLRHPLTVALLLASVVLFASHLSAEAQTITYNIVDYPLNETDTIYGTTDKLSGTIITDGALGGLAQSDILGGSWTLSNASVGLSFTYPIVPPQGYYAPAGTTVATVGVLAATTQSLILQDSGFGLSTINGSRDDGTPFVGYQNTEYGTGYIAEAASNGIVHLQFNGANYSGPGGIKGTTSDEYYNWLIATIQIPPNTSLWASGVDGNWSDSTKWTGAVPNADGAVAFFTASNAGGFPTTVTLDAPQTVGKLVLGYRFRYTLSGSGSNSLTLSPSYATV